VNQLDVLRGGALTTVQDLGRRGYAYLAVPRSGALDVPALRLANRLVGDPEDTAVLETTLNGVAVRPTRRCHIAVTGARAPVRIGTRQVGWGVPLLVEAGETVDVGTAQHGVRSYLAVSGGIAVEPVLGSRSTDLLSGLGPPIVRTGGVLPIGQPGGEAAHLDFAPYPLPQPELDLVCYLGPRDDRLTPQSVALLRSATWTVTPLSNRVGLRLAGPALAWRDNAELLSEGVVLGAVQVPPDGQPVVFLADHPCTGGYPVVGVVPAPDIWLCGQARPGTVIRLHTRHLHGSAVAT
jgi:biotin-dependent carboxylase-like uncharacterized protein